MSESAAGSFTRANSAPFANIAIVGVGLIGGSIAAALRRRAPRTKVLGVGRSAARLKPLIERGWLNETTEDICEAAGKADLIIFCTPVDRIVGGAREAATACRDGTLMTDAGSVKGLICRELATGLPSGVEFIGGHPLAGSEKTGYEFADPDLFAGRLCILTPHEKNSRAPVAKLKSFWELLGANVREMTPAAHDKVLAETSHLPHLIASALASVLAGENRPFTATGFRDTTRIAAGEPDLWGAILLQNADEVLNRLTVFDQMIDDFRIALEQRDGKRLRELLAVGKRNRDGVGDQRVRGLEG